MKCRVVSSGSMPSGAPVVAPEYKREWPIAPGWYWFRPGELPDYVTLPSFLVGRKSFIVEIIEVTRHEDLNVLERARGYTGKFPAVRIDGELYDLDGIPGDFVGPLEEPQGG